MRVVIDSNRVQTDELAALLSASRTNRAVVTDWLMMEAYKGDTLNSVHRSLGVLTRFPDQVVVLKNTGMCMKTRVGPQMANRLIWREHTRTFPAFVAEVGEARRADGLIAGSMLWRGEEADLRMERLERAAAEMLADQERLGAMLSAGDVDAIRRNTNPPEGIMDRIVTIAQVVAQEHRRELGIVRAGLRSRDEVSDVLFRVGISHACRVIEWIRTGSQASVKPERVRNDYIDAMISMFGTYFNGVMTVDGRLASHHALNRAILARLGATLPPVYRSPAG